MSCSYDTPIPLPPTTLNSCAVPLGGANSTLLDSCCNGEVNPIRTYSASNSSANCYQYCTTNDVATVRDCLSENMNLYGVDGNGFKCFNTVVGKDIESAGSVIGRWSLNGRIARAVVGVWVLSGMIGVL